MIKLRISSTILQKYQNFDAATVVLKSTLIYINQKDTYRAQDSGRIDQITRDSIEPTARLN
jgi:hypothetical protein